jgi:hypothetical protein
MKMTTGLEIQPHSRRLTGLAVAGLALVAAGSFTAGLARQVGAPAARSPFPPPQAAVAFAGAPEATPAPDMQLAVAAPPPRRHTARAAAETASTDDGAVSAADAQTAAAADASATAPDGAAAPTPPPAPPPDSTSPQTSTDPPI